MNAVSNERVSTQQDANERVSTQQVSNQRGLVSIVCTPFNTSSVLQGVRKRTSEMLL